MESDIPETFFCKMNKWVPKQAKVPRPPPPPRGPSLNPAQLCIFGQSICLVMSDGVLGGSAVLGEGG